MRTLSIMAVAVLLLTGPALADDPAPVPETPVPETSAPADSDAPADKARRGLDLLLQALEGWIDQIPSYAPPEVTPEGDIIIRRLDKPRGGPVPADPPVPGGATRL